jgi:hypothetical protein
VSDASGTYWTNQRYEDAIYADHERNHTRPEPQCWYCQNELAEARTDNDGSNDAG